MGVLVKTEKKMCVNTCHAQYTNKILKSFYLVTVHLYIILAKGLKKRKVFYVDTNYRIIQEVNECNAKEIKAEGSSFAGEF